jgi:hypothetical protein
MLISKAMQKGKMQVIATTVDGKRVMSGIWFLKATEGLPLGMVFMMLRDRDMIPCWLSLYEEMKKAGMKHERIIGAIGEGLADFGFRTEKPIVIGVLERVYNKTLTPNETSELDTMLRSKGFKI